MSTFPPHRLCQSALISPAVQSLVGADSIGDGTGTEVRLNKATNHITRALSILTIQYNGSVKRNLGLIGFFQATGLVAYSSLIAWIMSNANTWFSPPPNFIGPLMFLSLFVVSAGVCGLIFGAYAFTLAWEEKKTKDAIRLLAYTLGWLAAFVAILLASQIRV